MARSFSQDPRSDSHKIGETRYRMSHHTVNHSDSKNPPAGRHPAGGDGAGSSGRSSLRFAQDTCRTGDPNSTDENDTDPVTWLYDRH